MKIIKNYGTEKLLLNIKQGFVLPFTMLITVLILFISTGAMTLLSKQLFFSRLYRQSQIAYYAADDAVSCATSIDDTYVALDGLGIFPSAATVNVADSQAYIEGVLQHVNDKNRQVDPITHIAANPSFPVITLTGANAIKCGQSTLFDAAASFTISPVNFKYYFINPVTALEDVEDGKTVSYTMKMDLGPDTKDPLYILNPPQIVPPFARHLYRCSKVTINKTPSYRQIIAQGYSSCEGTLGGVERAVVNETVAE